MDYSDIKVCYEPSVDDLSKIEVWLAKDLRVGHSPFYKNWDMITRSVNSQDLIVLRMAEKVMGFIVWTGKDFYAEIDIMNISSEYKGLGLGRYFFEEVSNYFKSKGFLAIKLFCQPKSSEGFWKKVGFVRFPNAFQSGEVNCYMPLIQTLPHSDIPQKNRIELWDINYGRIRSITPKPEPKWIWNIDSDDLLRSKPILFPCFSEWNMRWIRNGKIIFEDGVKYLSQRLDKNIYFSPFIYVEQFN